MAGSLANILNKGSESLANSRMGIDVTGHNIANAHTPGYSRQIVNLETKMPIEYGVHVFGDGAKVQSISRAHDGFLEGQIRREIQNQSKTETHSILLQKLESLFNPDLTSTIRDRIVSFTNSVRELSNSPEEQSSRINVIENGKALTQCMNSTYSRVVQIQADANEEIHQNLESLNQKLKEIAILNGQIREMGAGGQSDVNDLQDKQDKLIKEVGSIIDLNAYKDKNDQMTLRGPNECLLVEGGFSSELKLEGAFTINNLPNIIVSEFEKPIFRDITKKIYTGKIAALLEMRDKNAEEVRNSLNTLAKGFGEKFNSIHENGYGINEYANLKGRKFFMGLKIPGEPALNISIDTAVASNPNALGAAMTPGAAGDNVVANNLVKMFYEPHFENNSETVTGLYDKMIAQLGHHTEQAKQQAAASQIVFDKLKSQQEAFSGVSLDEEASNLIKFQHLFNASSKIITTYNDMFQTVLDLKR